MEHILPSQVDRTVQSFSSWKTALHAEDFVEFKQLIPRSDNDYKLLYAGYKRFQRSKAVVKRRNEIYK